MIIETNKKSEYQKEYNLVHKCLYHVIFCPKYRRKVLGENVRNRLTQIIYQAQNKFNYTVIELEIMEDHVHLLCQISAKESPQKVISRIKGFSASILRFEFPFLKSRLPSLWTRSSFIATVGSVSLDVVKEYIKNQKDK